LTNIPDIRFANARSSVAGFEVVSLEELFARHLKGLDHDPHQPHRVDFYVLLWLQKGNITHTLDFREYTVQEGETLLITKGQVHAFNRACTYQGYIILFTEEFLLQYVPAATRQLVKDLSNYHLSGPQAPSMLSYAEHVAPLLDELKNPRLGQAQMIGARLAMLLITLKRAQPENRLALISDVHYSLFEQFQQQVETQYAQSRDAKVYAEALGISYKHLNEVSKKFTGKTAKAFIDQYVLLESKRLLTSTLQSVKEIAYRCGFDEPTNFLKYFKNLTGKTPQQFRES